MITKVDLRKKIRQAKSLCSVNCLQIESKKIMSLLEQHRCFQEAHVVLMYHSLADEPFTHEFLEKWYHDKIILLPVVVGDSLLIRKYEGRESMVEGAFHILEPQGEVFVDYGSIDLVVVPGMAFDVHCHRLGRGKGYYDRFLSSSLIRAYKLGLCFDFQKVTEVPVENHDIIMDEVL